MSIRHSDKCTRKQADDFKNIVLCWLNENGLRFSRLIALTAYDGEVRIHTGEETIRPSRRKVLQKDDVGYFRAKTKIVEKNYWPVYRTEWTDDEKNLLREYLESQQ